MPPRNKVFDLPQEVREELNEKLVSSGFQGYEALAGWLSERGYNVSKSSVHRYGQDLQEEFEEAMGDVRKTTELARAMASESEDESGHLIDATARIVQDQLLRISIAMRKAEHEPDVAAKHLSSVTKALADIGRVSLSQKKWAKELRVEVAKEAAEKAETAGRAQGLSNEGVAALRAAILEGMS
ncbi:MULTISPECIES: DUF3486 family protein [unclassified Halomonas]|uniref:DUF3486 family protein n=1 Tax=unclassified Halomonas TaxID=2609666 RepID=UPI00099073B6|nr:MULTISPECIES: DUF3486 family protein [unclassified Halomonas]AQU83238.1 hypothetical protein B2G49_12080 [Halomonas sp. 'Soap Lake \